MVLAIGPGHLFDDDAALTALDTAHTVQQEDQKTPEGNELEAPDSELIVARRRLVTPGADGLGAGTRPHGHFNTPAVLGELHLLINEARNRVTLV